MHELVAGVPPPAIRHAPRWQRRLALCGSLDTAVSQTPYVRETFHDHGVDTLLSPPSASRPVWRRSIYRRSVASMRAW